MWRFLLAELAKPLIRRIGSMATGALIGVGIANDQAVQVEQLLTALLLLAADLGLSHLERGGNTDG